MTLDMRIRGRRSETPSTGRFLARVASNPEEDLRKAIMTLSEATPGSYTVLYGMRVDGPDFHTCMLPNDDKLPDRVKKLFSGQVLQYTYNDKTGIISVPYNG